MVKAVASRPTDRRPSDFRRLAVASAMCRSGMPVAASISSATMCMVLVASRMPSAPAFSRPRAASTRTAAVPAQSPSCCISAKGARSTLWTSSRAECNPPSRDATPVEQAVVLGRARPAHPTQHAQESHRATVTRGKASVGAGALAFGMGKQRGRSRVYGNGLSPAKTSVGLTGFEPATP